MALVFYSSRHGYDDQVDARPPRGPPARQESRLKRTGGRQVACTPALR